MDLLLNIIEIILFIICILSILIGLMLVIIRKLYLIKCTFKNRKFDDKRLVNKINEFVNAIFHDPDQQNFGSGYRVSFVTREENQLNEKFIKYIKITFSIFVVSILLAFLIAAILGKVKSKLY